MRAVSVLVRVVVLGFLAAMATESLCVMASTSRFTTELFEICLLLPLI